jgi:hypothetical protein
LTFGAAYADPASEVKGTFQVNGAAIPIKCVYLLQHDNEEGVLDGPELRILLTDREVDPSLLSEIVLSQLDSLAHAGKVRGIVIKLDPKKEPREMHGTLLMAPGSAQASLPFFTESGSETSIKKLDIKGGKATVELDYASTGDSAFSDMPKFSYKLSFTAPIRANDPITARSKGADAAKSVQVKTMMAFEKAVRSGELDAARKMATESRFQQIDQAAKQMGKEKFLEQARQWITDPAVREKQSAEVIVRGKRAVVVFDEGGARNPSYLIEDGGIWKVN